MGRHPKYLNDDDRLNARREQNRRHVRAFRDRQKRIGQSPSAPVAGDEGESPIVEDKVAEIGSTKAVDLLQSVVRRWTTPDREILHHTTNSPFDSSFGAWQALLQVAEQEITGWPWHKSVVASERNENLIKKAVFAGATQLLGRQRMDDGLVHLSRQSYNSVLQDFRHSIARHEITHGPLLDTIEVAVAGFRMLEHIGRSQVVNTSSCLDVSYEEDQRSLTPKPLSVWLSHLRNAVISFAEGGPSAYSSPFGLDVLRAKKTEIVFATMYDRRSCVLDNDEWRALHNPQTFEDDLWHLIERIPAFLERYDKLSANFNSSYKASGRFVRGCPRVDLITLWHDIKRLHQFLHEWYKQLEVIHNNELFQSIPSSTALLPDDKRLVTVFPECFSFINDRVGKLLTIYWCYEMRLITIGLEVQRLFTHWSLHSSDEVLPYSGPRLTDINRILGDLGVSPFRTHDLDDPAINICKSMEYIYHLRGSTSNVLFHYPATLPIRIAMFHFAYQAAMSSQSDQKTNVSMNEKKHNAEYAQSFYTSNPEVKPSSEYGLNLCTSTTKPNTGKARTRPETTASLRLAWCKAVLKSMVQRDFNAVLGEAYINELYDTPERMEARLSADLTNRFQNAMAGGDSIFEALDVGDFERYRKVVVESNLEDNSEECIQTVPATLLDHGSPRLAVLGQVWDRCHKFYC